VMSAAPAVMVAAAAAPHVSVAVPVSTPDLDHRVVLLRYRRDSEPRRGYPRHCKRRKYRQSKPGYPFHESFPPNRMIAISDTICRFENCSIDTDLIRRRNSAGFACLKLWYAVESMIRTCLYHPAGYAAG
jgi:hypothetical protein